MDVETELGLRVTIVVCAESGTEVPRYRMGQVFRQPVTAQLIFIFTVPFFLFEVKLL